MVSEWQRQVHTSGIPWTAQFSKLCVWFVSTLIVSTWNGEPAWQFSLNDLSGSIFSFSSIISNGLESKLWNPYFGWSSELDFCCSSCRFAIVQESQDHWTVGRDDWQLLRWRSRWKEKPASPFAGIPKFGMPKPRETASHQRTPLAWQSLN